MEPFDRLVECLRRIISQQALEITERNCTLIEIIRIFYLVISKSICNELIRSPVITLGIFIKHSSVRCRDHVQCLPLRISAIFNNPFSQIRRNPNNIFHKLFRLCENIFIHSLKDHLHTSHSLNVIYQKKCVIDMTASVWLLRKQFTCKLIMIDYFHFLFRCHLNHYFPSHRCFG